MITTEPTFSGCEVAIRPIGLLRMHMGRDSSGPSDAKLVGVPEGDPSWSDVTDAARVAGGPARRDRALLRGLQDLEGGTEVEGWDDAAAARKALAEARHAAG